MQQYVVRPAVYEKMNWDGTNTDAVIQWLGNPSYAASSYNLYIIFHGSGNPITYSFSLGSDIYARVNFSNTEGAPPRTIMGPDAMLNVDLVEYDTLYNPQQPS